MLSDRYSPGLSLAQCSEQSRCVGVRLSCHSCGAARDIGFPVVVADLTRRGVGGWDTGIRTVAVLARRPCAKCGEQKYATGPAWS